MGDSWRHAHPSPGVRDEGAGTAAGPTCSQGPLEPGWPCDTSTAPYLDLLSGVGEGQRVDAAGGPAGLEHVRAVSEDGLAFLSRSGVLSCF